MDVFLARGRRIAVGQCRPVFLLCVAAVTCVHLHTQSAFANGRENLPVGHLQKLGSHQAREGFVIELREAPHPIDFYEKYAKPGVPVLFKGVGKTMPAFRLWNDAYLKAKAGDEPVAVEPGKKENRTRVAIEGQKQSYTLGKFLDEYNTSDIYMVDAIPEQLTDDFHLLRCLLCGGFTAFLRESIVWFSSGGTKSVLHNDPLDNINCLLSGKKEFFLADKKYADTLPLSQAGHVELDVDAVDLLKTPQVAKIRWWQANLDEGDCLFIPDSWLHQVRSFGRNLVVNIRWHHLYRIDSADCFIDNEQKQQKPLPAGGAPFSDFEIRAASSHRAALLDDLYASEGHILFVEDIYRYLKSLEQSRAKDERMSKQLLKNTARGVFEDMDSNRDWRINEAEVYKAQADLLQDAFGDPPGGYSIEQLSVGTDEEEEDNIDFFSNEDKELMDDMNEEGAHQKVVHAEL